MKTITDAQMLGEKGINLIQSIVLDMGFTWHPSNQPLEAGIDGWVELRDRFTGEVQNVWLPVQSRARTDLSEDEESVSYSCSQKDVEYWMKGSSPVILIVSKPEEKKAWWVSVKDYFRGLDLESNRTVRFDRTANALTTSTAEDWKTLSNQYGATTYFSPIPITETLTSNLLEVRRYAPRLYRATALHRSIKECGQALKRAEEYPPPEWSFESNAASIYSFHDLSQRPWTSICETSSVEQIDTENIAISDDSFVQGSFKQLLDGCLQTIIRQHYLRYSKNDDCYYFAPTKTRIVRTQHYRSRSKKTKRDVVSKHMNRSDSERIAYYRHVAFSHRFIRFANRWYLMIEPTYVFTRDGKEPDPYAEEHLSKIKTFEGDGAVAGTVQMFASIFRDRDDLVHESYEFLGFGDLESTQVGVGIDDDAWARLKASARTKPQAKAPASFGEGVFD